MAITAVVQTKLRTQSLVDMAAYPILTEEVGYPPSMGTSPAGPSAPTPGGAGGGSSLGQMAARAVSDVLGWKLNPADSKGFVGALTSSFTLTDVEGHVETKWTPKTYAVQTDLGGGITGAQASLYSRANEALNQCLSLLDGLYPLDPDADPEYVAALREMAKSQFTEIVKEMAIVPPSILRINTYFEILLGQRDIHVSAHGSPTNVEYDPDKIGGTLGDIRNIYGIKFQGNIFSNSIEDEQDITNFRIISDYTTSLLQSWISNGRFFELDRPKQEAFFGTQLVLISRQFSVIVETLNIVRFSLDSVFIGPAERQALLLKFRRHTHLPAMFLEDMFREIENLCSGEGPRLLQDGGRISVTNNIIPVAEKLLYLVEHSKRPENFDELPDGFKTVRVQNSLDDLRDQLNDLITLASQVGRKLPLPDQQQLKVTGFQFNTKPPSKSVPKGNLGRTLDTGQAVTIYGTGFLPNASISIASSVSVGAICFFSAQRIDATLFSIAGATPDNYDVIVTNPDGDEDTLPGAVKLT